MGKEAIQETTEVCKETAIAENCGLTSSESRCRVERTLQSPAVIMAQSKEIEAMTEALRLEEGYADAVETQKFFQLLRTGEKAPDYSRVLESFSPEMLALAQRFQSPTLILETEGRSFAELTDAMNAHKAIPGQKDAHTDDVFRRHASVKPEQWGAYIIEGPVHTKAQDFDNVQHILKKRLEGFATYKQGTGAGGMNRLKALHLMMLKLKDKELMDDELWTILDEDPALFGPCVPRVGWSHGRRSEFFGWDQPYDNVPTARFRRSVGGAC